jgi:heat shock protein HslJ
MKVAFIVGAMAAVLSACTPGTHTAAPAPAMTPDMHTSQNSLDWAGVYEGILPCADCPGMKTRLTLDRDGSYELSTRHLERPDEARAVRGRFAWNAGGNSITLDAPGDGRRFAVGEGRLSLLDRDGTPGTATAPNRVLKLVTPVALAAQATAGWEQTLEAHRWTLESATDGQGRRIEAVSPGPGRAFVFSFAAGRLHVQGACNQLTSGYQINEGRLVVGRMAATMMACDAALMQADSVMADLLAAAMRIEVVKGTAPQLRLVGASNDTLVLIGQATPEALYGPGTLIFLEVAAQRVACRNPLSGDTLCLQVRDRQFDAQGLPAGTPGEWRPLYENIEGFQHRVGESNVVRLKRFQRDPAPAGASSTVYVLDLIVETRKGT